MNGFFLGPHLPFNDGYSTCSASAMAVSLHTLQHFQFQLPPQDESLNSPNREPSLFPSFRWLTHPSLKTGPRLCCCYFSLHFIITPNQTNSTQLWGVWVALSLTGTYVWNWLPTVRAIWESCGTFKRWHPLSWKKWAAGGRTEAISAVLQSNCSLLPDP